MNPNPYDDGWLLGEPREMSRTPPRALRRVPHDEAVDIAIAHAMRFLSPSPPGQNDQRK